MSESGDFFVHFSVLPDPRTDRTKKHFLVDILFIAVCTIICGGEGFTDMEEFGEAKEEWLRKYLDVTFNEDKSRIRKDNAPENLVVLRRIALNMVKKEQTHKKASVRRKVKAAGWDNSYLERILVS